MLDIRKEQDIKQIAKYGKAKGILLAKRYQLPTFSHLYITSSLEEIESLLEQNKLPEEFCMRSDVVIGMNPVGVKGKNGDRETVKEYMKQIQEASQDKNTKGVAMLYWSDGKFCHTYEIEGSLYIDYRTGQNVMIDYVGKGYDGSVLSHGTACHESYNIPWEEVLFLNERKINCYRQKLVQPIEYKQIREERIEQLVKDGVERGVAKRAIPEQYERIKPETIRQIIEEILIPMYGNSEMQRYYEEYITIVQIENGKIVVPEIIRPERLRIQDRRINIKKEEEER